MDIGSLLLALALLLVVAAFVARPILDRVSADEHPAAPADALLAERENVLVTLRELDFDHDTGKIADEDYQTQRAALVSQGAGILRQLDTLGLNGRAAGSLEAEVEAAIAARRRRHEHTGDRRSDRRREPPLAPTEVEIEKAVAGARTRAAMRSCPQCGAIARAGDKFCHTCGTALSQTCPACGTPFASGDKFCGNCGTRLDAPAEAA